MYELSPRERQIASMVHRGWANARIADAIERERRTVETHLHNLLGKLEFDCMDYDSISPRALLVLWWERLGRDYYVEGALTAEDYRVQHARFLDEARLPVLAA